ncbi:MAG: 3-methyl-2-oxobutanoate hydroxymethyltransferase [Chloroflexi bacterium]|nr:3-methyl-2-oxobutanoate hydroxymethyltransferase [Chloroflexota bacterium]MQC48162.1 3-methyl-2-oxobutanoate hydroxymethyltransferase [Chloroflexota bacterium]
MARSVTIRDLQKMRDDGKRITMVTAYDYPTAKMADEAGVDVILVGDTLGMVVLGYDSTLPVTVGDMIHHGRAVVRGAKHAHVVIDMPFGSYQRGWRQAMQNATRIMKETGAGSVKLEGGMRSAETVRKLVEAGIPVMGHVGLTPQSVNQFSGFRVQGKTPRDAVHLINDARSLADAGAYAIVLELVPTALTHMITQRVKVPTIGIGAGPFASGQVQVWHDVLGMYDDLQPKHARKFANVGEIIRDALQEYVQQVRDGSFPTAAESFFMDEHALDLIRRMSPSTDPSEADDPSEVAQQLADASEHISEYEETPTERRP